MRPAWVMTRNIRSSAEADVPFLGLVACVSTAALAVHLLPEISGRPAPLVRGLRQSLSGDAGEDRGGNGEGDRGSHPRASLWLLLVRSQQRRRGDVPLAHRRVIRRTLCSAKS